MQARHKSCHTNASVPFIKPMSKYKKMMLGRVALPRFGAVCFILVCSLMLATNLHADNIDRLVKQLRTSKKYKVRLSAALGLSKTAERRSVNALSGALLDPDKTVRGVAASGLGRILDSSSPASQRKNIMKRLKKMSASDSSSFVRKQAQKAWDVLKQIENPRATVGGGKVYVNIGAMAASTESSEQFKKQMRLTTLNTFRKQASEMMVSWPGGGLPNSQSLKKKKTKAFHVDGNLVELKVTKKGNYSTVKCSVSMLIASFPQKKMFGFLRGGAEVSGGSGTSDINEAKSGCVEAVVEDLVRRKILPTLKTRAKQ